MKKIKNIVLNILKVVIMLLVTVTVTVIVGCSSSPKGEIYSPAEKVNPRILVEQYLIGVDDEVQVNVWKNPDLSITVPVRPDGKISVPLVGEVVAGGKAPVDVAKDITQKLSKFIKDPQVQFLLAEAFKGFQMLADSFSSSAESYFVQDEQALVKESKEIYQNICNQCLKNFMHRPVVRIRKDNTGEGKRKRSWFSRLFG